MRYARDLKLGSSPEVVLAVEEHIRAHLSAIATEDDDPDTFAEDVRIEYEMGPDYVRVTGILEAEPTAPYLRDGFDPDQDVADNPLSVPSIEEGS